MPHDVDTPFTRLLRVIDNRAAFPAGAPVADWAFDRIVRAQILVCDLASLREVHAVVGREAIEGVLANFMTDDLDDVLHVLDPHRVPARLKVREDMIAGIADLASGSPLSEPPPDRDGLDLAALRRERDARGDAFGPWLEGLGDTGARSVLARLDPHHPFARRCTGPDAFARLLALAEDSQPIPFLDLGVTDGPGLAKFRARVGERTFAAWAGTVRPAEAKALAHRILGGKTHGAGPVALLDAASRPGHKGRKAPSKGKAKKNPKDRARKHPSAGKGSGSKPAVSE